MAKRAKPEAAGFLSAEPFLPRRHSLTALRRAAADCRGCPLYQRATQTVFGAGPRRAELLLVGEVPGDQEDRQGEPFVGPAGRLLDEALEAAGIGRDDVYVTNAVKHFKWEPQGKRRLHQKPNAAEIRACRPWLEAELAAVAPSVIVCLGATAAQSLLGKSFRITKQRGRPVAWDGDSVIVATYHPSAVLRAPDAARRREMKAQFIDDLRVAQQAAGAN